MTCGVTADADTGQKGYGALGGLSKFKRKGDAGGNASLGGGFLRRLLKVGWGGTSHSLLVENSDPPEHTVLSSKGNTSAKESI